MSTTTTSPLVLPVILRRFLLPPITLDPDKIRPNGLGADALRRSISEMRTCKLIFDGWAESMDQMDKTGPKENDALEGIHQGVDRVRNEAVEALAACEDLVQNNEEFSRLMVWRLDQAAKGPFGTFPESTEANIVHNRICSISSALSQHVSQMLETVGSVVSLIQDTSKRSPKKSFFTKVCGFLTKTFKFLASALSAGSMVSLCLGGPSGAAMSAALSGGSALAAACAKISDELDKLSSYDARLERITTFLQITLPQEAKVAEGNLLAFQQCQGELQAHIKEARGTGRRVRVPQHVARALCNEWIKECSKMRQISQLPPASRPPLQIQIQT